MERQDNRQRARHAKRMKRYRQRKILVLILAVLVVAVAGFAILYQAKQSPIKLNGDAEMTISLNGVYDEPGATAKIDGKDYSKKIKIDSEIYGEVQCERLYGKADDHGDRRDGSCAGADRSQQDHREAG